MDRKKQNLYSRQSAAIGTDTTAAVLRMRVAVVGMNGLAAETCKNLLLLGVGEVKIFDDQLISHDDLGVNFLFSEEDLGLERSFIASTRLQELNSASKVSCETSLDWLQQTDENLSQFTTLVITRPTPLDDLFQWNTRCRLLNVTFLYAMTGGICAHIFGDFGEKHTVYDADGSQPIEKNIEKIVKISDAQIRVDYSNPDGRPDRLVTANTFYRIDGYADLLPGLSPSNAQDSEVSVDPQSMSKIFKVERCVGDNIHSIRMAYEWDTANPQDTMLQHAGFLRQVKMPETIHCLPLKETLLTPSYSRHGGAMSSWYGFPEPQQDIAFTALHLFLNHTKGRMPTFQNAEDRDLFLVYARELFATATGNARTAADDSSNSEILKFAPGKLRALDESFLHRYIAHIMLELQPMAAFVGGLLAFEVIKKTGKFRPMRGLLHFSFPETIPQSLVEGNHYTNEEDFHERLRTQGLLRYRTLIRIFGFDFMTRCQQLRIFQIGCGALGCEYLKNFALNGFCSASQSNGGHPGGLLHVTDADTIELSNLSRQFLFREHNVGHSKSAAAVDMMKQISPHFQAVPHTLFVGPSSETTFNDTFWQEQDIIVNALDNIPTRMYSDRQCVLYGKPLFEAGTEGVFAKAYTIIPHLTNSYEDIHGQQSKDTSGNIPMCTLRDFPYIIEHCIEWSRDLFALLGVNTPQQFQQLFFPPPASASASSTSSELLYEKVIVTKIRQNMARDATVAWQELCLLRVLAQLSAPVVLSNTSSSFTTTVTSVAEHRVGVALEYAKSLFQYRFHDRIVDLQRRYPQNYRVVKGKNKSVGGNKGGEEEEEEIAAKEGEGIPFWDEKRRYPTAAVFDVHNALHRDFVWHLAALLIQMISVKDPKSSTEQQVTVERGEETNVHHEVLRTMQTLVEDQDFVTSYLLSSSPSSSSATVAEGSAALITNEYCSTKIEELLLQMQPLYRDYYQYQLQERQASSTQPCCFQMNMISFEKDQDDNHHVDFLTATTNLRAFNYSIPLTTFQHVKVITGRIIPALAPTTSAICGLVTLQMFTLLRQATTLPLTLPTAAAATASLSSPDLTMPVTDIFNRFIDLGTNMYLQIATKPVAPKRYKTTYEKLTPAELDAGEVPMVLEAAYPDSGYTKWDMRNAQMMLPASMTMAAVKTWFAEVHQLELRKWLFAYGKYKPTNKNAGSASGEMVYATTLYTNEQRIQETWLPDLSKSEYEATMAVNADARILPATRGRVMQMWLQYKKNLSSADRNSNQEREEEEEEMLQFDGDSAEECTLLEMFRRIDQHLESLSERGCLTERYLPCVTHPEHRRYLPITEGISCRSLESGDDITYLAPIVIRLDL